MKCTKSYRFRLYPTPYQEQLLLQQAGACRWVWNWALEQKIKSYNKETKKSVKIDLSRMLTELKKQEDTKWLKECESQSLQQVLRDLDKAFQSFFSRIKQGKKPGFPKFKSKRNNLSSVRCTQHVRIERSKIRIPTIGLIKIKQHRSIEGVFKTATFKRNSVGRWYVTLPCHIELPSVPLPKSNSDNIVGLDAGLKDFYVLSNGEKEPIPHLYRKSEKKLRKLSKSLSRKKKGSKRREKAKKKLAKLHLKISNQRNDFLHKKSQELVNKYDGICVEDLNLSGLTRTKLSKSFNDAAHGEFVKQLEYKCLWNYKHFVKIDRWYPSSKTCNNCGYINKDLKLSDREWICDSCGITHDRDLNAARNIRDEGMKQLAVGYTESLNARRDDVRPLLDIGLTEAVINETRTTVGIM